MSDLLINNQDAQQIWGVHMGRGFLNALLAPSEVKEYITNEVRDENGTRYYVPLGAPYLKERNLQLPFVLIGATSADFFTKQQSFLNEMYKGSVMIKIPAWANDITFRLYYNGQSSTWQMNASRTLATITLKFTEPNPNNRN